MKPVKYAIALAIHNNYQEVFVVLRSKDEKTLPNVWGLPASMLKEKETFEDAVIRTGHDKLGVELKIIKLIGESEIERDDFILHMKEYEVKIVKGEPAVPQPVLGVTQYQAGKWSDQEILKEAAQKGSLCSRLYLSYKKQDW